VCSEQLCIREEGIWPTQLIGQASPGPGTLFLFAQERPEPAAHEAVDGLEGGAVGASCGMVSKEPAKWASTT